MHLLANEKKKTQKKSKSEHQFIVENKLFCVEFDIGPNVI